MTAPAVSVVMPAFNEAEILAESVGRVLEGLERSSRSYELIVVENGSTDATPAIVDDLADAHECLLVTHLPVADYGRALRAGLLRAGGDVVVNFDADYYDLGFLEHATDRLADPSGPSIIVGSKRAPGADDSRPLIRRLVTAAFSQVLRVVFHLGVSDTHGMKAMRRTDVIAIARECKFGADLFDTELVLRAERDGMAVTEVPVRVAELRPPRTSIVRRAPRALAGLVRLRLALVREDP